MVTIASDLQSCLHLLASRGLAAAQSQSGGVTKTCGGMGSGVAKACGLCGEEVAVLARPHSWFHILHCREGGGAQRQPLEQAAVGAGEPPTLPLVPVVAALARKKRVITRTRVTKRTRVTTRMKVEGGDDGEVSELELEDSDAEETVEMEVEMEVDPPPRPSVFRKVAGAPAEIMSVVATRPSVEDEEMEDKGEEDVGKVEVADAKSLGEGDTGDHATLAAPPSLTTPSTPALPPSPLAVNDDIATATVVDTLLGVVTHKMVVTHKAPSTSESRAMRQVVKRFVGHGDLEKAWAELRRCRWVETAARGTVEEELREQVALYLELMRTDSGVEVMKCNRYCEDAGGAKVVATRRWRKGEMVASMVAATHDMTEEEDAEVMRQGKAFSLGQYGRRGGRQLWLGPLAYINHSCQPNCKYVREDGGEMELVMVEEDIRPGEELTSFYAPDYFGKKNCR